MRDRLGRPDAPVSHGILVLELAPAPEMRAAHRALAEAIAAERGQERRAWHLAWAAVGAWRNGTVPRGIVPLMPLSGLVGVGLAEFGGGLVAAAWWACAAALLLRAPRGRAIAAAHARG